MSLHEQKMETVSGCVSNYPIVGQSLSKMAWEELIVQSKLNTKEVLTKKPNERIPH